MVLNGAQIVVEALKREGVQLVFGYPGGVVLPLYDELYKSNFMHILPGHEQGAVHAADGYARATGKCGVAIATSGPGVCNMVTGIATANMDSIPLVVISGQVAKHLIGRDSFQEADISGIATPITKHNYLVKDVHDLPRVLKEAFFIATTGRPGPVLVDIATNVFHETLDFEYPSSVKMRGYSGKYIGQEYSIDRAVEALQQAKKPVFLVGGGVNSADMAPAMRKVAELTQAPVITTLLGKGAISDKLPTNLGMVGMHGSYAANMAVTECDLLVGIGARFDDRVTGNVQNFAPNAKVVHFDIDPVEINKIVHSDLGVTGDLRWSLPLFAEKVARVAAKLPEQYAEWREHVFAMREAHPFASRKLEDQITPEKFFKALEKYTDDDTFVVTDVGQHQMWTAQFAKVEKARHFISSGGLGTMGFGLPAAMGAKLGNPKSKVVLVNGDGGIMMCCQELDTLTRYGIDVKVFVLSNQRLGMVNQWQRLFFGGRQSQSVLDAKVNLPALAESMGVMGQTVADPEKLDEALAKAFAHDGAVLTEVRVPADENVYPMVPAGARLDEMLLLEDEGK